MLYFPRNHRHEDAPPGVREHADRERVIVVDGVESVDQLVADDGPDLGLHVDGMPVDDVGGAIRTQNGFVSHEVCGRDDGSEAGEGADLHGVFAAVAACADDDDGLLAVID